MPNLVSLTNPSLQILGKTGQSLINKNIPHSGTSNDIDMKLTRHLNLHDKHGNVKKVIIQKLKTALEYLSCSSYTIALSKGTILGKKNANQQI